MNAHDLTSELARALGLPKYVRRAVLTLEAGEPPRLELTMYATDNQGRFIVVETMPSASGEGVAKQLAQVQFMLRLEPFSQA